MSNLENNLFYYATKELSQDAFICWLCSFALEDADKSDMELVKCAQNLICEFLKGEKEEDISKDEVHLEKIEKQVGNIDVLLTVRYKGLCYKIIIEDKTYTSEHDDQLARYRKQQDEKEEVQVIGIYFKTGYQSDWSAVKKAGYKVFDRKAIISALEGYSTSNDVFNYFRNYWTDFDVETYRYKEKKLDEGDWRQVNGFFEEMQAELSQKGFWAGYGYVPNQSGGFRCLWYGLDDYHIAKDGFKAALSLHVEMPWNYEKDKYDFKVCAKLEFLPSSIDDNSKYTLKDLIIDEQKEFGFIKPGRLGHGRTMTIGIQEDSQNCDSYEAMKSCILKSVEQYPSLLDLIREKFSRYEG